MIRQAAPIDELEWRDLVYDLIHTIVSMNGNRKSSKIFIPHTEVEGCNIVGILEQLDADDDTRGRPIAFVQSSFSLTVWVETECTFAL